MRRLKRDLGRSLGAGLVVADQDDDPTVRCSLGSDKLLDCQVGSDRRPLKVAEHDDAD